MRVCVCVAATNAMPTEMRVVDPTAMDPDIIFPPATTHLTFVSTGGFDAYYNRLLLRTPVPASVTHLSFTRIHLTDATIAAVFPHGRVFEKLTFGECVVGTTNTRITDAARSARVLYVWNTEFDDSCVEHLHVGLLPRLEHLSVMRATCEFVTQTLVHALRLKRVRFYTLVDGLVLQPNDERAIIRANFVSEDIVVHGRTMTDLCMRNKTPFIRQLHALLFDRPDFSAAVGNNTAIVQRIFTVAARTRWYAVTTLAHEMCQTFGSLLYRARSKTDGRKVRAITILETEMSLARFVALSIQFSDESIVMDYLPDPSSEWFTFARDFVFTAFKETSRLDSSTLQFNSPNGQRITDVLSAFSIQFLYIVNMGRR